MSRSKKTSNADDLVREGHVRVVDRPEIRRSGEPTIDDVARHAGVSKGTVSHVLSGKIRVSPQTRARVEGAIRDLAFQPAEAARSLTARKRLADGERHAPAHVPRLTTVGYVSVDFTAQLDRLPRREERRLSRAIGKTIGGPAANVAAVAAGIGPPFPISASILTAIGVDQDSDWATAELWGRRVDVITPPERRSGRVNRALVLVEADGRRTIVNEPSLLAEVDVEHFLATTDAKPLTWCLHFEGYQVPSRMAAVAAARKAGFVVSMQATGMPPDWLAAHHATAFGAFDIMVLHRESLTQIEPAAATVEAGIEALAALACRTPVWPRLVVVTLGERGAVAVAGDGALSYAAAPAVEVVDLTGAGDAFVGALLAAVLNDAPTDMALRLACAAGSLQTTRYGAQEVLPGAAALSHLAGMPTAAFAALTNGPEPIS
ncbi:PfkB family carbohydrate kinase [Bosea sp. RAC05]|uniref:PfkB family carbohydrate kinase n=1 Tax=Bosea sp. RAC05 TaxID=1842539 RepID=UPI0009F64742|nr:PfkB family carbohydrate kinase [Bosea sp. RAC05]